MTDEPCVACGGWLRWFDTVHDWRHVVVPEGVQPHPAVRYREDYVQPVPEADPLDTGPLRIVETREEIEARGRAMREALGVIEQVEREHVVLPRVEEVDPEKVAVHPQPEVPARPALDKELPSSALQLKTLMVERGWKTDQQYARGWRPDVHRRWSHTRLIEVVVVRGRRLAMAEMVVACWSDGKYDSGYWRTPGGTEMLGSTELKKKIKIPAMLCTVCGAGPYTHAQEDCA